MRADEDEWASQKSSKFGFPRRFPCKPALSIHQRCGLVRRGRGYEKMTKMKSRLAAFLFPAAFINLLDADEAEIRVGEKPNRLKLIKWLDVIQPDDIKRFH